MLLRASRLRRFLLAGEFSLLVSLFHALNDCTGFLADIERSPALKALKRLGEVVDESALGRFIKQLKRPN
jgi:hypothetical protein